MSLKSVFENQRNLLNLLMSHTGLLSDEEKIVNQGQERRVILNLIKLILNRAASQSPLSKGATLRICQELLQYFSMSLDKWFCIFVHI